MRPQARFNRLEAAREFGVRVGQRLLAVAAEHACHIDEHEEQIAKFVFYPCLLSIAQGIAQFADFLLELVENTADIRPFEANTRRAVLKFLRTLERGQGARYVVEYAFGRKPLFLLVLPCFPDDIDIFRLVRLRIAEDVGMAADHFLRHAAHHVVEGKQSRFLRHLCVVDDLQQQIAQFIAQAFHVADLDRIRDLVSFLDRVRGDAAKILRKVPRAAAVRVAQRRHDAQEFFNFFTVHRHPYIKRLAGLQARNTTKRCLPSGIMIIKCSRRFLRMRIGMLSEEKKLLFWEEIEREFRSSDSDKSSLSEHFTETSGAGNKTPAETLDEILERFSGNDLRLKRDLLTDCLDGAGSEKSLLFFTAAYFSKIPDSVSLETDDDIFEGMQQLGGLAAISPAVADYLKTAIATLEKNQSPETVAELVWRMQFGAVRPAPQTSRPSAIGDAFAASVIDNANRLLGKDSDARRFLLGEMTLNTQPGSEVQDRARQLLLGEIDQAKDAESITECVKAAADFVSERDETFYYGRPDAVIDEAGAERWKIIVASLPVTQQIEEAKRVILTDARHNKLSDGYLVNAAAAAVLNIAKEWNADHIYSDDLQSLLNEIVDLKINESMEARQFLSKSGSAKKYPWGKYLP